MFSGYHSPDAVTWTQRPGNTAITNLQTLLMDEDVYVGLAVTSHNVTKTAEAYISHVSTGYEGLVGRFSKPRDSRL